MIASTPPELTLRACVIGFFLALILSASNAYLGLKMGLAAGPITAAVITIAVLYMFKNCQVLERNMVQIAASAGQSVAAAIIFTLPALLMLGVWSEFSYTDTVLVGIIGGGLGLLFSVPLRRAMIVEQKLPYPEGRVIAEVLKLSDQKVNQIIYLLTGSIIAAIFTVCQTGLKIINHGVSFWTNNFGLLLGAGFSFSPLMLAAGYILGFGVVATIMLGNIMTWQIAIPILSLFSPEVITLDTELSANTLYKEQFRYASIGTIVFGGLWGLITLYKPILRSLKASSISNQKDIPMSWVIGLIAVMTVPLVLLFLHHFNEFNLPITEKLFWLTIIACTFLAIILGFFASSVSAYIAGLAGATTLPMTGISISAICFIAVFLMGLLGTELAFENPQYRMHMAGITIIFGAMICLCATIGADNMQDLSAGYILGATPWKQQLILFIGILGGVILISPILNLLFYAYGIGDVLPRHNMDASQALLAPQAMMLSSVTQGMLLGNFNSLMFSIGVFIGIVIVIIDYCLEKNNSALRIPVLAFGLGMYLPMTIVTTLFLGGLLAHIGDKLFKNNPTIKLRGTLIAAGLIAGEAVTGILLAIPSVLILN